MAKTHGRSALPLPEFLTTSLRSLGWVEMDPIAGNRFFRHPRFRRASLLVVASNMPGDTDMVVVQRRDHAGTVVPVARLSADQLVHELEQDLQVTA
jgi:hypothetical protein